MGIETDLSISPYFDDINNALNDNYHRILFRPSVAVQARELTQLQDILQNQIERFGDNIYEAGTIISGCNFNFDMNYYYAKIRDIRPLDQSTVIPASYIGLLAHESTTNLYAICINSQDGYESQDPNLKTLYFKYVNSGANNAQQFPSGGTLQFYTNTNPLGANTSTYVSNGDLTIASTSNSVGTGYAMSVGGGVIFQKGHFIHVANNTTAIISKYSNAPDGVVAGFNVVENIVTELQDPNLFDNASGFTNENAPGAHRLQLIPTLVSFPTANTPANNFFALVEWDSGNISKEFQQTQFSSIGNELARRTYEEAGNYYIKPFRVHMESGNDTHNYAVSSAGIAYIEGHRVEQINNIKTPVRKGTDIKLASNQQIITNYDNSVLVNEFVGSFPSATGAIVSLRDTAGKNITNDTSATFTAAGSEIGKAKIIAVEFESGVTGTNTCTYRLYLTDIRMNSTQTFDNVRGIYYGGTPAGFADIVTSLNVSTNTTIAMLSQPSKSCLVYDTTKTGSQSIAGTGMLPSLIYRTQFSSLINYQTGNSNILQLSGNSSFNYPTGTLIPPQEQDIIVIPTSFAGNATFANVTLTKTGTVNVTSGAANVTGNATNFLNEYQVGDYISIFGQFNRIVNISNNLFLTLDNTFPASHTNQGHNKCYPINVPINFVDRNSTITITDSQQQHMQLSLIASNGSFETLSGNANITVHADVLLANNGDRNLQANTSIAVRLNMSNSSVAPGGPQCLGVPYVYNIRNVYKSSNVGTFTANIISGNSYVFTNTASFSNGVNLFGAGIPGGTTANVVNSTVLSMSSNATASANVYPFSFGYYSNAAIDDVTQAFQIMDGQKDAIFDLSFLKLNPSFQGIGIGPTDLLTVIFDAFMPLNTGHGYISIDSYNTIINTTSLITYEDIPTYTSAAGVTYNLRDSIDFRLFAQNTAPYQTSIANSIINPPYSTSISNTENYIISPKLPFKYSLNYYRGRIDKLLLNSFGNYSVVEGTPADNPVEPADKADAMTLAVINVPVFPSTATTTRTTNVASSYLVSVTPSIQNRGYTMKDIASLDHRLSQMEYYTALNLLEANAASLTIPSSLTGQNRFKNGISVDNYTTTNSLDVTNTEFKAQLSPSENALIPQIINTNIPLKFSTGSNVVIQGNYLTLDNSNTSVAFLSQTLASNTRICTDNSYKYNGVITTSPAYNQLPDLSNSLTVNTPSPYVVGQLNAMITPGETLWNGIFPSSPTWYIPWAMFVGYTQTGFIQIPLLSEAQAILFIQLNIIDIPTTAPVNYTSALGVPFARQILTPTNIGSYRFTQSGYFIAPETGSYTFTCTHDDGFELTIGTNSFVFDNDTSPLATTVGPISLTAGQYYRFSHTIIGNGVGTTESLLTFTVNGNTYSQFPTAGQKQIVPTMWARDGSWSPKANTFLDLQTVNPVFPSQLIGNNPIPGLNISRGIYMLPNTSIPAPNPVVTNPTTAVPILSDISVNNAIALFEGGRNTAR